MNISLQATQDPRPSMGRHMKKWMDQVLGPVYRQYLPGEAWSPAVNLYEDDVAYHVVVDLAGVSHKMIDLRVEKEHLIISGDRPTPRPLCVEGLAHMHLMEIDHGTFCRSVEIPEWVDQERIVASYRCGMLHVYLPKKDKE
jgi:HSP20 family protein